MSARSSVGDPKRLSRRHMNREGLQYHKDFHLFLGRPFSGKSFDY